MSNFVVNEDLFGRYCKIQQGNGELHIYKIVSRFRSNSNCDLPDRYSTQQAWHPEVDDVVSVIHCGINETEVKPFRLSDVELIPAEKPCKYCDSKNPIPSDGGDAEIIEIVKVTPLPAINLATGEVSKRHEPSYHALHVKFEEGLFEYIPIKRCPFCGRELDAE